MNDDLVVGVDCSTTAAKAVVWDATGRSVSSHRTPYDLDQPRPGWGEQNAEDWWSALIASVRRAVQVVDPTRVRAISITHQRETFVLIDRDGRPLRPGVLWLDSRAIEEVERYGTAEVHQITGKPPNVTPAWYKLLWLRKHEPETWERLAGAVDVHGFLVQRLTGQFRTSIGSADPLGLVDMTSFDYHDGLLAEAGLTRSQVPELVPPGAHLGGLLPEVSRTLGLPSGLPVIAGTGDGQSAQLGVGAVSPGRAYLNLGSGVVSGTYSETYSASREYRVLAAAVPGGYTFETFIGGGTHNIAWFVDKFAGLDPRALGLELTPEQVLETAAAQLPPGAGGVMALPYWTGALTPYWDHHARGMLIGLTGAHGKSHVYRALLEGIAFEQRFLYEGVERALGIRLEQIIALGGGSRSSVWCQIVADVMGRPVDVVRESESTCLGAGMLAAAAVGVHDDIPSAAASMSGVGGGFVPGPEAPGAYDRLYDVYVSLYPALRDVFPRLAAACAPVAT